LFWGLSFELQTAMLPVSGISPLHPTAVMPSRSKTTSPSTDPDGVTFEQALEELEAIIHALDGEPQGLDELVTKYERGMGLLARCQQQLDAAQLRIEQITQRADGSAETSPLASVIPGPARPVSSSSSPPSASPDDEIRLF
jgi:exodeoxyribonuclease VII small subunit